MKTLRHIQTAVVLALAGSGFALDEAWSQPGPTPPLPASTVIARGTGDGWQSRGGVVGPWWRGSGNVVGPSPADGSFWFGLPGLGFGGSQGSSRGNGTFSPGVTALPGAAGTVSSSRLVPFVTGVVPVVGSGNAVRPEFPSPSLQWAMPPRVYEPSAALVPQAPARPNSVIRPSSAAARNRAREMVASGDLRLLTAEQGSHSAQLALGDYRSAARFAADEPDILIRQAIVHEALGKRREADRALARATSIDARLAAPHQSSPPAAGGFLAPSPGGTPLVALRGEAILAEIRAGDEGSLHEPATDRPMLAWLLSSWKQRWPGTIAESAADPPATDSADRRGHKAP